MSDSRDDSSKKAGSANWADRFRYWLQGPSSPHTPLPESPVQPGPEITLSTAHSAQTPSTIVLIGLATAGASNVPTVPPSKNISMPPTSTVPAPASPFTNSYTLEALGQQRTIEARVYGSSLEGWPLVVAQLRLGEQIWLRRMPDSYGDVSPIGVFRISGQLVGCVSNDLAKMLARDVELSGGPVIGVVTNVLGSSAPGKELFVWVKFVMPYGGVSSAAMHLLVDKRDRGTEHQLDIWLASLARVDGDDDNNPDYYFTDFMVSNDEHIDDYVDAADSDEEDAIDFSDPEFRNWRLDMEDF